MASITLTWTASDTTTGGTPSNYCIYRADGTATENSITPNTAYSPDTNKIGEVSGSTLTYVDTSVVAGNRYSFTVVAKNTGGYSSPANNPDALNILA